MLLLQQVLPRLLPLLRQVLLLQLQSQPQLQPLLRAQPLREQVRPLLQLQQ